MGEDGQIIALATGHFHATHRMPITIARDRGWLDGEGLPPVRIFATGEDPRTVEGLRNGTVDVALDLRSDIAIKAIANGLDARIVGCWRSHYPYIFFGGRGVKTFADLIGKKIPVVGPSDIAYSHGREAVRAGGLDPDRDVVWSRRPHSVGDDRSKMEALRLGESGADSVPVFMASEFEAEGFVPLFDFMANHPGGYPDRVSVARRKLIVERPDVLKGLLKCLIRAHRFVCTFGNFTTVQSTLKRINEEDRAQGGEAAEDAIREPISEALEPEHIEHWPYARDGGAGIGPGLQLVLREEQEAGRVPAGVTVNDVADLRLVQEALREVNATYGDKSQ